jgi:ADP-heptose:LPS heptosyltransferase
MSILEKIKSLALRIYCYFVLPGGSDDFGNILVFMDMGIGNAVWMIPVLRNIPNLYIDCPNPELRELLKANVNFKEYDQNIEYTHCIANFLVQRNQEIYKIIKHRIPNRIGHDCRRKYRWMFNTHVKFDPMQHEKDCNGDLWYSGLGYGDTIQLPKSDKKYDRYDVLIQAHSSNDPKKDYPYYRTVIQLLPGKKIGMIGSKNEYDKANEIIAGLPVDNLCGKYTLIETCHLMTNARVVLGNDGGLTKIADQMGINTIQIFRYWTDSFNRASVIHGVNLLEPTVYTVVSSIKKILE